MSASAAASFYRALARAVLFLTLGLGAAETAQAQGWKKNPRVDDDLHGNPSDVVCFEMRGRAFVVQAENDAARIHWTTLGGWHRTAQPATWTDGSGVPITGIHAACRVGERDFFLAYTAGQQELRVARLQWNTTGTVTTVAGWVQVGSGVRNVSMVLRETGSGVDGVLLVWQRIGLSGPIHQEGVSQSGSTLSTVWGGPLTLPHQSFHTYRPSIVSTGDGLGVATYMRVWGSDNEVWAAKHDGSGAVIFAMPVPGQVQNVDIAWKDYRAASDGTGGAFFAYSTHRDPFNADATDLVHARIAVAWSGSAWIVTPSHSVWQTTGANDDHERLRPLAMLAMPGSTAMVIYRDETVIRALRFDANLSVQWLIFVRGADLTNDDEADAILSPEGPVLVVTANHDVMSKKLNAADGQPIWDHGPPRFSEILINGVVGQVGNAPRRPRVFATGEPDTRGFLFSWYDDQVSGRPDPTGWFAERIRSDGKLGRKAQLPGPVGTGGAIDSTVFMDQFSNSHVELESIEVELGDGVGTVGNIEVWTRIGQTYQGHENAGGWTLAASANVTVAASPWIEVDMIPPVALAPGTNGIAIRGVGLSLRTVAGTGMDSFGGDPDDLTVTAGSLVSGWPGGAVQPARVLSGALCYRLLDGPGTVATATSQGTGCGSVGPLLLTAATRPVLGTTVELLTTSALFNNTLGLVVLGFAPVPGAPLDFLGMPGCHLYQTLDMTFYLAYGNGAMSLSLALPDDPFLIGAPVYAQSAVRDPFANPFGLAASNGLTLMLGNM